MTEALVHTIAQQLLKSVGGDDTTEHSTTAAGQADQTTEADQLNVWDQIDQLQTSYGAAELGLALRAVVQQSSFKLQRETANLNIHADAAALQFAPDEASAATTKCGGVGGAGTGAVMAGAPGGGSGSDNGYIDRAGSIPEAQSVADLLCDGQREHVALHMLTEKEWNGVAVLEARVRAAKAELRAELFVQCKGDVAVVEAACTVMELEADAVREFVLLPLRLGFSPRGASHACVCVSVCLCVWGGWGGGDTRTAIRGDQAICNHNTVSNGSLPHLVAHVILPPPPSRHGGGLRTHVPTQAGLDEAIAVATEEAVRLEVLGETRLSIQCQLKDKYDRITHFKEKTAEKHAVIQELLRAQSATADGLVSAASTVQKTMRSTLTPAAIGAAHAAASLRTRVEAEDATFETFPLSAVRCAVSTEIYNRGCHWIPRMFA
jgi:hypothetical protein